MIREYVSASGVFVESISHAEMWDSFRIVQFSGKPGENGKRGKASLRTGRLAALGEFVFLLSARES